MTSGKKPAKKHTKKSENIVWDNNRFSSHKELCDWIYEGELKGKPRRTEISFEWGTGCLMMNQYINEQEEGCIYIRKEEYLKLKKFVEKHGLDSLTSVSDC